MILAGDTLVVLGEEILGKPKDEKEAFSFLKKMSGRSHLVKTGIALLEYPSEKLVTDVVTTEVWFHDLSDEQIQSYISTGEAFDKAGAYGIQGEAKAFVKEVKGSVDSVIGLPLDRVIELLKENNWNVARAKL